MILTGGMAVATLILAGCYFVSTSISSSPSVPQEVTAEIVARVVNKVVQRPSVINSTNSIVEGIPNTGSLVDSGAGAFPIGEQERVRVVQSRAPRAPQVDTNIVPEPASVSSADSEALTGSGNPFWDCFKRMEYKGVDPGEDRWLENAVERSRAQDRGFNINEVVYNTYIFAGDVFTWLKKKCFRPRRHVNPKSLDDSKVSEKAKEEISLEEINAKIREEFDRFMEAKAKAKPTFVGSPKAKSEVNGLNIDDIPADFDPSDDGGGPPDSNPFLWIVLLMFLFSFVKFILTP
jgi:hypothetical protein